MAYGSLLNAIADRSVIGAPTPEPGMGATELLWTDRHAGTITWVSANGKRLRWRRDKAIRTDSYGMSDVQSYRYEPDPNAVEVEFTLRKNGRWIQKGSPMRGSGSLMLGTRREYYDYSF
jgi:hypothetical protein